MALSLIAGFVFMLVVERQLSAHSHSAPDQPGGDERPKPSDVSSVEFDVELSELEQTEAFHQASSSSSSASPGSRPRTAAENQMVDTRHRAYPLTLGLVVHALADGLALGSAALSGPGNSSEGGSGESDSSIVPSHLSLVVFLALLVHKGTCALCAREVCSYVPSAQRRRAPV